MKILTNIRNSCASHPVGTHLKVRDYASANSLLLGGIVKGSGVALDIAYWRKQTS